LLIFTKEEQKKEDQWAADKMYHAARWVWKKRFETMPSDRVVKITWADWFKKMFKRDLFDYANEMAKRKKGQGNGKI